MVITAEFTSMLEPIHPERRDRLIHPPVKLVAVPATSNSATRTIKGQGTLIVFTEIRQK
jgi:hypothetical protein